MLLRAGDGFVRLDTQTQWQPSLGAHDPNTQLPIGFDAAPMAGDVVPIPTGPTFTTIATDQVLPPLAPPAALMPYVADPLPPRPQAPPRVQRIDGWFLPPLGKVATSVLDVEPPRRPPAPVRQPLDWLPPPLVSAAGPLALPDPPPRQVPAPAPRRPPDEALHALATPPIFDEPLRPRPAPPRAPTPEGWFLVPLTQLFPWFDASPPRWFPQPRGPIIIEPWGLDPLPVLGKAPLDYDAPRPRLPAPPRAPSDLVVAARVLPIFDQPPGPRALVIGRPPYFEPAMTPFVASALRAFIEAVTPVIPPPPKRQPIIEPWGLDPLPVLGKAPIDQYPPQRPAAAPSRLLVEATLRALRAPAPLADTFFVPAITRVRQPIAEQLGRLLLRRALEDAVFVPRAAPIRQPVPEPTLAGAQRAPLEDTAPRIVLAQLHHPILEELAPLPVLRPLPDAEILQRPQDPPRLIVDEVLRPLVIGALPPVLADQYFRPRIWIARRSLGDIVYGVVIRPLPPMAAWAFAFPGYSVREAELLDDPVTAAARATDDIQLSAEPVGDSATVAVLIPFDGTGTDVDE